MARFRCLGETGRLAIRLDISPFSASVQALPAFTCPPAMLAKGHHADCHPWQR